MRNLAVVVVGSMLVCCGSSGLGSVEGGDWPFGLTFATKLAVAVDVQYLHASGSQSSQRVLVLGPDEGGCEAVQFRLSGHPKVAVHAGHDLVVLEVFSLYGEQRGAYDGRNDWEIRPPIGVPNSSIAVGMLTALRADDACVVTPQQAISGSIHLDYFSRSDGLPGAIDTGSFAVSLSEGTTFTGSFQNVTTCPTQTVTSGTTDGCVY